MKSTKNLKEEHESIEIFLKILESILSMMRSEKQVSLADLQWLFEFNRDYILKCHNGKEERILFPVLECMDIPLESINFLLGDHEIAWRISKTMRGLIQDCIEDRRDSEYDLIDLGRCYINFVREHIEKEEAILYPLIDEYISRDDDEYLDIRFNLFVEESIGIGRYMDLEEMLEYLKSFYGI